MSRFTRLLAVMAVVLGVSLVAANPASALTSVTISTPTPGAVTFTYSGNTDTGNTFVTYFASNFGGGCPNAQPVGGWTFMLGPNTPQAALGSSPATVRAGDQGMGVSAAVTITAGTYEYCTYVIASGQVSVSGSGTVQFTAAPVTPTTTTTTTTAPAADPVTPAFTG